MKRPIETIWELGRDRFRRRVTMRRDGDGDIAIKIDPANQRDEGEHIRYLNEALILEAASILAERKG